MNNHFAEKNKFVCTDCFKLKKCKESSVSWAFFFVALIATIAIRVVNVLLDFSILWAKIFWYIGVLGFLLYFLYRFRYDHIMHRELDRTKLADKMLSKQALSEHEYEILGTILCRLSSKKDKINYFFIFLTSGLALLAALYADFFR